MEKKKKQTLEVTWRRIISSSYEVNKKNDICFRSIPNVELHSFLWCIMFQVLIEFEGKYTKLITNILEETISG